MPEGAPGDGTRYFACGTWTRPNGTAHNVVMWTYVHPETLMQGALADGLNVNLHFFGEAHQQNAPAITYVDGKPVV